ncbi:hypothetical protein HV824_01945 [Myxococcus sp. AM009]|uniref:hypothetical protein n=1 Tax=unclassified Myxococcus TaxID=2648731 RepID=UPI001595739A|nr:MULTISPECIES: hypothetical protein [unclassified Myxococcus]NVI96887.1 hypothetical protein [Myxococcus sp. AM009]NVJ13956.1 hypothetical protein [Myxococcus sp. AM010]
MTLSSQFSIAALSLSFLAPLSALASGNTVANAYVDVSAYLTSEADIEAWYQLSASLKRNFDDICGDTFCEGEYSNIESLRFRCSVNALTGRMGQCVWVFAASNEEVDPATGAVTVDAQTWACQVPLAPRTTMQQLLAALAGTSPLYATLPRTQTTIYEGLGDCL